MGSSRRSASSAALAAASAAQSFDRVVVAFSGGLDSTVLLHAAVAALGADRVIAAHVHHGLQAAADAWPAHCEAQARLLGVAFECARLAGAPGRGESVEAWAREHRYRALATIARRIGGGFGAAPLQPAVAILTAHHADDQAETVLMRAMRGAGAHGLAGIAEATTIAGARVLRPLLHLSRAELLGWAREHGLAWIEDPSNDDLARTRNAVRHRVLPALERQTPTLRAHLLAIRDAAVRVRDAADVRARADLAAGFDRSALAALPAARRAAALRAWIVGLGLGFPSRARLAQIERQLVLGQGAYGEVVHEGVALRRYRDRVWVEAQRVEAYGAPGQTCEPDPPFPDEPIRLRWRGEAEIALGPGLGSLRFDPVPEDDPSGVPVERLLGQSLSVRRGGQARARLRPGPGARTRTLKNLYQERGVPAQRRRSLPLVFVGELLVCAAGIGVNHDALAPAGVPRVMPRWVPGAELSQDSLGRAPAECEWSRTTVLTES